MLFFVVVKFPWNLFPIMLADLSLICVCFLNIFE